MLSRFFGLRKMACQDLAKTTVSGEFLKSFDTVLTDCDGVIWLEDKLIPGALKSLSLLREQGKKVLFVSNNSTKSTEEYLKKFTKLGIQATSKDVFATSKCAALCLKRLKFTKSAYLVGSKGIAKEFDLAGIPYLPIGPDPVTSDWSTLLTKGVQLDPNVGAVVIAFDEHLSYLKMLKANSYLKNPECLFVSTNTDKAFPCSNTSMAVPGTGAILAAFTTASSREPILVGKPDRFMFEAILQEHPEINPERCLMIGDRLDTDILFGRNIGSKTLAVLSGVTTLEELKSSDISLLPDYYLNSLNDLIPIIEQSKN